MSEDRLRLLPHKPTCHPAGSREKNAVLAARHGTRMPLWHPEDSQVRVDQRPDPEPPILFQEFVKLENQARSNRKR